MARSSAARGLINALVLGVETAARVGNCVGRIPHEGMGFHGPGLMGTFASVASASHAAGLSADQLVHALGHAGQQAASLMFTHHGGMGKRLLAGQAARAGTFAALLAQNGFTNAPNVFEAEYGGFLCGAHRQPAAAEVRPEPDHQGLGPQVFHRERALQDVGDACAQSRHAGGDPHAAQAGARSRSSR